MLEAGEGDRSLSQKLDAVIAGELSLPPGCEVTYELRALDMLRAMLKQRTGSDEAEAWYRDFRDRMGERPTAAEFYHAGFHPTRTGHGTWFDFVHDMGDLVPDAADVHRSLLQRIERANFVNPGPLYVLEALLPGLSRGLTAKHLRSRTLLRAARSGNQRFDDAEFSAAWSYWESSPDFSVEGDLLALRRREAPGLPEMLAELIAWRSAAVLEEGERASDRGGSGSQAGPELWREYIREDIPPLFGTTFNPGNWNSGIVPLGNALILLTTLKKGSLSAGNHYDDRFLSATRLQWQSQTQTRRDSKHGRILSGHLPNSQVHLFVRSEKLRETKAAPFLYLGIPQFSGWQGDKPITVEWDLGEPIPEHFRKMLGVP